MYGNMKHERVQRLQQLFLKADLTPRQIAVLCHCCKIPLPEGVDPAELYGLSDARIRQVNARALHKLFNYIEED